MKIFINVKQAGCRGDYLGEKEFELPHAPATLHELIDMLVNIEVAQYNAKSDAGTQFCFISESALQVEAQATGKVGFQARYNANDVAPETACEIAAQSLEDGLIRIFVNNCEINRLNEPIKINENDRISIIRLVMLAGRMW